MKVQEVYNKDTLTTMADLLFKEERAMKRLDGWFITKQIIKDATPKYANEPAELKAALLLKEVIEQIPLVLSDNAVFAGTQRDAFARSYALINPTFTVETFAGYCDPTAVFNDIDPDDNFPKEKIAELREFTKNTPFVSELMKAYDSVKDYTGEVAFFIEQVTGHVIADFKPMLAHGVDPFIKELDAKIASESDATKKINFQAMRVTLESAKILAKRYQDLAKSKLASATPERKAQLEVLIAALENVPAKGASSLFEAIQSFLLLWQLMCVEQSPNPFAFSVGNADRIFEPYRAKDSMNRDLAAGLFKQLLVFFNVGDRSWAISQNLIVSGKSSDDKDLTNEMSYAILDAYYETTFPQPILSVKMHRNTPQEIYKSLGRFFFTPGCLTPSLFNDDMMFDVLTRAGVEKVDLENYSIAGCQEALIMGKDNANTTNSWLNLAKILELSLNDGVSTITNKKIGPSVKELGFNFANNEELLKNIRTVFYKNLEFYTKKMCESANMASVALSNLPVPFLSSLMGGLESGYDMRDPKNQGTKYNGSGCLIHGSAVVADSFVAIDTLLSEKKHSADDLISALKNNFKGNELLKEYLSACPKFGNNNPVADKETVEIVDKTSDLVAAQKNYLGNPFRPDWSSPSTHLLYGFWVGATPDGRKAREMLNYGIDPLAGEAQNGLGFRVMSTLKLPFEKMSGGCASHLGIDPNYFKGTTYEEKGVEFYEKVIKPLFFSLEKGKVSPFYIYFNVTTPEILRKVLANPKKYAPSGVYIMRIHGTFVNFLDLSPDIQQDIITRLDLNSTSIA